MELVPSLLLKALEFCLESRLLIDKLAASFRQCHYQPTLSKRDTEIPLVSDTTSPSDGKTKRRGRRNERVREQATAEVKAPVWPGVAGGRYRPLDQTQEEQVKETAFDLLENLGLSQATSSMIEKVTARGGYLDDKDRLHFPRELVNWAISGARRDVVLYARRQDWDLDLSGDRIHTSSGGGAPGVFDLETGTYRPGTVQDLHHAAKLVDKLDNIHHFSRSIIARDTDSDLQLDINTAYACLAGTGKHISISVTDPANMQAVASMCYQVAGSEAAFRKRPFVTIMVCHVVPPMRFATDACETLELAIQAGFPVQIISAGQAGATSPVTLAGSLVQAVAETLAGFVFSRLVDENVVAIFAPKPLVADLRTGAMCGGGGEQAVLMAGAAQMGRYFDLPTSSIAGITDAKTLDTQFGAEKTLAVTLAAQAGSNLITQSCGMQASLLGVSLEAYAADNDMLGNILRTVRGIEVDHTTLSVESIAEVCHGEGHYLGHPDTLERMKSDYFYPLLGDRQTPTDWQDNGAVDLHSRAREWTRDTLENYFPDYISETLDNKLRSEHDIVLARSGMVRSE